ncbi:hypothetical protein [Labrenzia sp. OB1]|uniref:hypothetical protein n=1 Tax=Labrenzia sp. OB1 TaxID=1561204 RepID=UPI0007B2A130|nr:hypothetical protein [Labrenzia sp. OB1]KZM48256.1 hypothetical protein OA90_21085 [Labrenzia sp. OB1]
MKPVHWLAIGTMIPIILFLIVTGLDTACSPTALMSAGESPRVCYREWIGALSGWVAALAAGGTIIALFHQIRRNEETAHKRALEAKQLFVEEIEVTLRQLNRAWKHAEDIDEEIKRGKGVEEFIEKLKREMKQIDFDLTQGEFEDLLQLMLPRHRAKCATLLRRIKAAAKEKEFPAFTSEGHEYTREPDNEELVELLLWCFDYINRAIESDHPELAGIFANRSPVRNQYDEFADGFFNSFLFGKFPNNPNNPY